MEEILILIGKILLKGINDGGLWGVVATILFSLSGWFVAWFVYRSLKKEREYWRVTRTLRDDANERVLNKAIEIFEQFIDQAKEQRALIVALVRAATTGGSGKSRKGD